MVGLEGLEASTTVNLSIPLNAVVNALAEFEVRHVDMPVRPAQL